MHANTILQDRSCAALHTPVCSNRRDVENHAIQSPACAPGTPSLLRQPSPLKELLARSQSAVLRQNSPAKAANPSPSPLKMHLFGSPHLLHLQCHCFLFCFSFDGLVFVLHDVHIIYDEFQPPSGSQLPQSRLPMPKSWLSLTPTSV